MSGLNEMISKNPMYAQISGLPDQIRSAVDKGVMDIRETGRAAICGMGTCAIAGRIVSEYMDNCGSRPVPVLKGIDMPAWVDSDTTVIVISYSGRTVETLQSYRNAVQKGAQVVCITSGGDLGEMCGQDGGVLIPLPGGFVSRGALGYMVGSILAVLKQAGFIRSTDDLTSILPMLEEHIRSLQGDEDNDAVRIARNIGTKAPVIYSYFNMLSASLSWKSQINENSKVLAFCGTLPEFNHNELVGWTSDLKIGESFYPIILMDDGASSLLTYMAETPMDMIRKKGIPVEEYHVTGVNLLEKTLKAIVTGGFVSLYLDVLNADRRSAEDAKPKRESKPKAAKTKTEGEKKPRRSRLSK